MVVKWPLIMKAIELMKDEMLPSTYERLNGIINNSPKLLAIKNTTPEEISHHMNKMYYLERLN